MKTFIAFITGCLAWATILYFFVAASCQQAPVPHIGLAPGLVWNYSNASTPAYFDLPVTRSGAGGIGRPGYAAPVILQQPCGTWNGLSDFNQAGAKARTHTWGHNACVYCHCFQDKYIYGWHIPLSDCINATGQVVNINVWNSNPDNLTIRWSP